MEDSLYFQSSVVITEKTAVNLFVTCHISYPEPFAVMQTVHVNTHTSSHGNI